MCSSLLLEPTRKSAAALASLRSKKNLQVPIFHSEALLPEPTRMDHSQSAQLAAKAAHAHLLQGRSLLLETGEEILTSAATLTACPASRYCVATCHVTPSPQTPSAMLATDVSMMPRPARTDWPERGGAKSRCVGTPPDESRGARSVVAIPETPSGTLLVPRRWPCWADQLVTCHQIHFPKSLSLPHGGLRVKSLPRICRARDQICTT